MITCPKCDSTNWKVNKHPVNLDEDIFYCEHCNIKWTRKAYEEMDKPIKIIIPYGIEVTEQAQEQIKAVEKFLNSIESKYEKMCLYDTLKDCLLRLRNLSRVTGGKLYKDFAPLSFQWVACGMSGGLIFHGDYSSGPPTFCVNIGNTHGWQMHS